MSAKKPMVGQKSVQKAVEEGQELEAINSDLETVKKDRSKSLVALELIVHGASWTKAAEIAGYSSPTHCRVAVERVLAESGDSRDSRDMMRSIQYRRYQRLLGSVMPKAIDPKDPDHLLYNKQAVVLLSRFDKIYALEEPAQVNIVTPSDDRIAEVLQLIRSQGEQVIEAQEADIFDAVVIVDGMEQDEDEKEN